MAVKTNLAYKELTLKKQDAKPRIKKVPKVEKMISPGVVIVAIVSAAVLLGYMVFNMVQLNQITNEINTANSQIKILKSEKVRLNSELESKMSLSNIENYAKENLGLSKLSPGQITYLNMSKGNSIEIPKEKSQNFIESLWSSIKNFFTYFIN